MKVRATSKGGCAYDACALAFAATGSRSEGVQLLTGPF